MGRDAGEHRLTDSWRWWPLTLICVSTIFNFFVGQRLLAHPSKLLLGLGLAVNVATIAYFKYTLFFAEEIAARFGLDLEVGQIVLPLGISFFVFQKIAYLDLAEHIGRARSLSGSSTSPSAACLRFQLALCGRFRVAAP